ncbi:MAG: stage III sporulation protein AE [Clostridia bacterium]|nr:stage III sporulation protein AE [Clostridia bacterium]
MKRMLFLFLLLLVFAIPVKAQQVQQTQQAQMNEQIDNLLRDLDFSELEDMTVPGLTRAYSVREAIAAVARGETISAEDATASVLRAFFDALSQLGALMLSVMTPVLLGSLLTHTLGTREKEIGRLSGNVCYLMVLIPVVLIVIAELDHARNTITLTTQRMDRMLPLLLTLLTALGGNASSAFLHPMVVAASGSMVFLAREVILRLVMCTCAVTTINHLSFSAHMTRMAQLLRSAVCWLLGVSFTVFLGAMSLQGVCSASIDGVAIRAAKYAVDNFVPIVGGMFSDTMDTLVGCTLIVKNALGVCAALVLLGVILAPLMRTTAVVFVLKLSAALLEPVADAQIVRAIGDFSRTIVLFLITMLCVGTMYFLLIVQMLLVGNLTVMLR